MYHHVVLYAVGITMAVLLLPQPGTANFYCHLCEGDRTGSCNFYRHNVNVKENNLWYVHCSDKGEIEPKTMPEDAGLVKERERNAKLEQKNQMIEQALSSCKAEKDRAIEEQLQEKQRHERETKDFHQRLVDCSGETHQAKYDAKEEERKRQGDHMKEKEDIRIEHTKCRKDVEAHENLLKRFENAELDILAKDRQLTACVTLLIGVVTCLVARWLCQSVQRLLTRLSRTETPELENRPNPQQPVQILPGYVLASPLDGLASGRSTTAEDTSTCQPTKKGPKGLF